MTHVNTNLIPSLFLAAGALLVVIAWARRGRAPPRPPPNDVVLQLGPNDCITLTQAYQGLLIMGGIGSGKTTGPAAMAEENLLRLGLGVLWLCAKSDEADRAENLSRKLNRGEDVRRVRPGGGLFIDVLKVAMSMPGGKDNACQVMDNLMEVGQRRQGKGEEEFWRLGRIRIVRNALTILEVFKDVLGAPSIQLLLEFVTTAAESLEQLRDPAWRATSDCWALLSLIDLTKASDELKRAHSFFTQEYPALAPNTRSSLVAGVVNILDKLLSGEVGKVISAGVTNVGPWDLEQKRIIIIDFPQLQYQEAGQLIAVAVKSLSLRHLLARDVRKSPNPVAIIQDEAQLFCLPGLDSVAQTVSRQQRVVNLVATQNRPVLQSALGGQHAETEVTAWLANFQNVVLCQNADMGSTNKWGSALIGEYKENFISISSGSRQHYDALGEALGTAESQANCTISQQIRPLVPPEAFAVLRQGGAPDFSVEAYVYAGGKRFSDGRTFMKAEFRQRF